MCVFYKQNNVNMLYYYKNYRRKFFLIKSTQLLKKKLVFLVALTFHFEADQKTKMSCVFHFFHLCVGKGGAFFRQERLWRAYVFRVCVCVFRLWIYYDYIRLFVSFFLSTLSSIYLFSSSWKTRFLFSLLFLNFLDKQESALCNVLCKVQKCPFSIYISLCCCCWCSPHPFCVWSHRCAAKVTPLPHTTNHKLFGFVFEFFFIFLWVSSLPSPPFNNNN